MTERDFEIVEGWLREAMEFGEEKHNEPYEKAIQALEEIQQYRAIGTVFEFRELKDEKYDCDIKHLFGECSYAETGCSDCIGKLKIKDALGKATAKKPLHQGYVYVCPCCNDKATIGSTLLRINQKYCPECGTEFDWSEEKE